MSQLCSNIPEGGGTSVVSLLPRTPPPSPLGEGLTELRPNNKTANVDASHSGTDPPQQSILIIISGCGHKFLLHVTLRNLLTNSAPAEVSRMVHYMYL